LKLKVLLCIQYVLFSGLSSLFLSRLMLCIMYYDNAGVHKVVNLMEFSGPTF